MEPRLYLLIYWHTQLSKLQCTTT